MLLYIGFILFSYIYALIYLGSLLLKLHIPEEKSDLGGVLEDEDTSRCQSETVGVLVLPLKDSKRKK